MKSHDNHDIDFDRSTKLWKLKETIEYWFDGMDQMTIQNLKFKIRY